MVSVLGLTCWNLFWNFYDQIVWNCRLCCWKLVNGQIEWKEQGLNNTLLHDDLVEIRQHVVDTGQIRHEHLKANRLGHVAKRSVELVWSSQVGTFVLFVPSSQSGQNRLLRSLMLLLFLSRPWHVRLSASRLAVRTIPFWTVRVLASWLTLHNLVKDMIFGSDQSLLNTFDHLFTLDLISEIMFENQVAMALAVQFKVAVPFNVLLVDHSQLAGHAVVCVNVQYMRRLPMGISSLVFGNSQERSRLTRVTLYWSRIDWKTVIVTIAWDRRFTTFVNFQVSQVKLETHQLLSPVVQKKVRDSSLRIVRAIVNG